MHTVLPVAIIGGGPVGLAAAAHLTQRNIPFVLFEAGNEAGANVRDWAHVRLFSPWKYNIDRAAAALLEHSGWVKPPEDELHTGKEFIDRYLQPLAELPQIKPYVHYNSKVLSVGRKNYDKVKTPRREKQPFVLHVAQKDRLIRTEAKAVIDASGTWGNPNPLGAGGIFAEGEREASRNIYYGIPDIAGVHRGRYAGKSVLVAGSGHSAINSLLELAELKKQFSDTRILWAIRKKSDSEA